MMKDYMPRIRRATVVLCSLLFVVWAARNLLLFTTRDYSNYENLVIGVVLLGLAIVVFRQYRWALRAAAIMCVFVAIVLPVGFLTPFNAGDYLAAGEEPPSVGQTLLWLAPVEILLVGIAFIIDPKKKRKE